ncbi:hypothetical protein Ancab_025637 [Ancistrocladus abbreviatus]
MSGQKLTGNRALATLAVENCPLVVPQREEDVAADLSISLQKGYRAADKGAGASSSLLVVPDSSSNREDSREQDGPLMLGHLRESGGFSIKQKKAHLMQAKKDKTDFSDFSKSPGLVDNSSYRQGQGQENYDKERCSSQNAPEQLWTPKIPQSKSDSQRNRGERKKNLQEILGSHLHGFKGGRRSRRLPRRKVIMWEKLSAHTAEHEEALISGMELDDSHILNMNRILCKQDAQSQDQSPCLSLRKIWNFFIRNWSQRKCTRGGHRTKITKHGRAGSKKILGNGYGTA